MKRLTMTICLICATLLYAAGQLISSSSLVVTKTNFSLPEIEPGYEQSIDVGYDYLEEDNTGLDLNYIGGWRFNRMFFAGIGTGLYFNWYGAKSTGFYVTPYTYDYFRILNTPTVNVPLYAHARVYFTKKRCMPFVGLSAGGLFSKKGTFNCQNVMDDNAYYETEYSTNRFLLNVMVGASYRMTARSDLYLSVGFKGKTQPYADNIDRYGFDMKQKFLPGMDAHIGFTF